MLDFTLANTAYKQDLPLTHIPLAYRSEPTLQKTLASEVSCEGIGVHSAKMTRLTLRPAPVNTGYVFVRTDLNTSQNRIQARWDTVVDTSMCTKIANEQGVSVSTIEHLMAALAGCGIHNVFIEIDGPEVPIMDGSSAVFIDLISQARTCSQRRPVRSIRVLKNVTVSSGGASASFLPSVDSMMTMRFDMGGRLNGRQWFLTFDPDQDDFTSLLSEARTFGFYEDAQRLWNLGLAKGASFNNTIVISNDGSVMNEEGLRYTDEFIRHKMLDAVGDLALSGVRILGKFEGINSGHSLNNQLLRALFADSSNWEFV